MSQLKVDTITDELGTGSPSFPNGIAGSVDGNAATATALQTARTLTIGSTGKSVDGRADVAWSLSEIGALSARTQGDWNNSPSVLGNVVGLMAWRNYSNNHVIFDASASVSPSGTTVNNTNAQIPWSGTYPTIMGWNGANTYGVRVDRSRVSDNSIGEGQSWQAVSRANGTSYQNTAGRSIEVQIDGAGGGMVWETSTDNVTWVTQYTWSGGTGNNERAPLSAVIPPGQYYRTRAGSGFYRWTELR
jgi:hypothetical protein